MSGIDDLAKKLFLVLGSTQTYQINFRCAGSHIVVEPSGFTEVMHMTFFMNRIKVVIDPKRLEDVKAGAMYEKKENTFYFNAYNYGQWPTERAAILHECVHAMQDLRKTGPHTYFQEEAAAYIAEFLHLRYATGQGALESSVYTSLTPLAAAADEIAGKIVGRMGAQVDLPDLANLIGAIQRDPTYADIRPDDPALNDGV